MATYREIAAEAIIEQTLTGAEQLCKASPDLTGDEALSAVLVRAVANLVVVLAACPATRDAFASIDRPLNTAEETVVRGLMKGIV